jgi:hypothetical protein
MTKAEDRNRTKKKNLKIKIKTRSLILSSSIIITNSLNFFPHEVSEWEGKGSMLSVGLFMSMSSVRTRGSFELL